MARGEAFRCGGCGARLARDNPGAICAACQRRARARPDRAPEVPDAFWQSEPLRGALARRDMGLVSRAYRHHPYHGRRPLPQGRVAAWLGITQGQLSRLEQGANRVGELDRLAHWARALRIPARHLWFDPGPGQNPPPTPPVGRRPASGSRTVASDLDDLMRRRQVLAGTLATAGVAATGATGSLLPFDPGAGSPPGAAQLLAAATRSYRLLEATTPSRQLLAPVRAHLALARRLAGRWADGAPGPRPEYAAVSEVASLAAWLHADLDEEQAAREHYRLAVRLAERSGDRLLLPYQAGSLGAFAAERGDARAALALLEDARRRLPADAPAPARAWLAAVEAVARAAAGDRDGALTALDAAERAVDAGRGGAPPAWPWVFAFDGPKLSGYRAACAARLGDVAAAEGALAAARPALRSPKAHAGALVGLAEAHARRREAGEACRLAAEALDVARGLDSERVAGRVRALRRRLVPVRTAETAGLDERLAAAYT
jgi:hypothetical protein